MLPNKTGILIVGAGPTGLALAIALQEAGVDHLLIDALSEGQNTSRAAVIHAHTLEGLDSIGVLAAFERRAIALSSFTIRDRDRPLLEIGFDDLPSPNKGLLMVPQSTTEELLADRLEELGGHIHRNVSAIRAWGEAGCGKVCVRGPDGEQEIEARYVVGADGMNSVVRTSAGIGFHGDTYGASFILADVRMDWRLGAEEVSLFFSPAGLMVVAPLPDDRFRIVATLDDAPETPTAADIQRLIDTRGPAASVSRVHELVWASRFRVHHRLADTYRKGPFLLMGDAAHVHSPAGGQGMNTGLVDAVVLGRALARIAKGEAPESALDEYAALRRAAAEQVLILADRLTRMATVRATPVRILRNLVLRTLNRIRRFKFGLAMNLSGLSRRSLSELPSLRAESPRIALAETGERPAGRRADVRGPRGLALPRGAKAAA